MGREGGLGGHRLFSHIYSQNLPFLSKSVIFGQSRTFFGQNRPFLVKSEIFPFSELRFKAATGLETFQSVFDVALQGTFHIFSSVVPTSEDEHVHDCLWV